ncbi:MAG: FkbM family methyltransferase [Ferrovibrio sp.]|uniref:FkbM family methyltransferase n=1 Tax=Ferrovibrio sp. TaxID=1917215 RepID=UPI002626E989|nr:FkbM family methyltransferase [Ferrovibrio sp.]MCW0236414.1 FkbM family methyltransferase [Ferrovibrio sp.]
MTLQDLLGFTGQINVMDIGASCINETPAYRKLLDQNLGHLNAFEGDERQIEKIRAAFGDKATVFTDFLSDGSEQTLYLAAEASGMTSLLKPDPTALKFFNGFENFGKIHNTMTIRTRRLDDVAGLPAIDMLKMDIQGSELSVLQNGTRTLKDCVALQLEVSFICLYENQPSFGEVDLWMRQHGFAPHCFLDVKRWSIAPTKRDGDFRKPFNQLLEADIVYVRNPLELAAYSDDQLRKLALIAHYCFASFDLCVHALMELIARGLLPADTPQKYFELQNRKVAPPPAMTATLQSWSMPLKPIR